MHTRKVWRYLVIPCLYAVGIFGLLYLQYSGTLTVRRSLGDLQFLGTLVAGEDETSHRITSARIDFQGITFRFSEEYPLVIDSGENQHHLVPSRYDQEERTLLITFSDESVIRFEVSPDEGPPGLQVLPQGGTAWPEEGTVTLSWHPEATLEERGDDSSPAPDSVHLLRDDRQFVLTAPPRSAIDQESRRISLPLNAGSRLIRYVERDYAEIDIIEAAFSRNRRQISDSFYAETISRFIDVGFQGWHSIRFNGGSGTWNRREGSPEFSEEILTAYLAEAWKRDQYTTAFNRMRRAADQHPESVGLLSAVFLGDLRNVTTRFIREDQERARELADRIAAGDARVFQEDDIFSFAALRGSEELFRQLLDFADDLDLRDLDQRTAVAMAEAALAPNHPTEASREVSRRFLTLVHDRIVPAIRQYEETFFMETAQGEVDLLYSLRAGLLLERYGDLQGEPLYVTVGRNLVLSGLRVADSLGFLPRHLYFEADGFTRQEGSFGPEKIYPLISDNPWYPRKISLYDELGAGSFIWSIAPFPRIDIGEEQFHFTLTYPRNRTHYIVMQGIPPFRSMNLFNLQWRNDPSFELYIKGRHYERSTNTLMIKYTDNSVEGDIILNY
ncbi:hypothetical protein [Alkalispirochaeta alkalica]|uniref:hypothetical protein n=1 Tax=Alkalispirochaeta alkalica TaxID=46356 RepID=UPI0012FDF786|nr:hypothetical protein [Alkalispirochaeta alkalica]